MNPEPATLEPIVYERVTGPNGKAMWKVPASERARWALPPLRPVLRLVKADDADPWKCIKCSAPLTRWAYLKGFRHCSRSCRESDSP